MVNHVCSAGLREKQTPLSRVLQLNRKTLGGNEKSEAIRHQSWRVEFVRGTFFSCLKGVRFPFVATAIF